MANGRNARGWSAYTTKGKTKADELATECMMLPLALLLGKRLGVTIRMATRIGKKISTFFPNEMPGCTDEKNFFMDNKDDIAYLTSMEGKQNIVNTHVEGIIQYIKEYEK